MDKEISYEEFITRRLNESRANLVERTNAYYEAVARRKEDPKQIVITQGGPLSITAIVTARVSPVAEARARVAVYEQMLAEAKSGKLESRWHAENVTEPVEIDLGVGK